MVVSALMCAGCNDDLGVAPFPEEPEAGVDSGVGDSGGPTQARWELITEDLDGALFSVWGTTGDDVWLVGADPGDGPQVMHYDGDGFRVMDTEQSGALWWVSGNDDAVWMSGEDGLVLRYDLEDEAFEVVPTPDDATLFGIFPIADDDVWAVGGNVVNGTPQVVYRYDGDEFVDITEELPQQTDEEERRPFFKVWGTSGDDIWIVGLGREVFHWDGEDWTAHEVPFDLPLFTVHGNDEYVAAVGGAVYGGLMEVDGDELVDATPDDALQLNGLYVKDDSDAIAVGYQGSIFNRVDGEWVELADVPEILFDYHAVFVDSDGGEWAVGGQITAEPYVRGTISHRGAELNLDGLPD